MKRFLALLLLVLLSLPVIAFAAGTGGNTVNATQTNTDGGLVNTNKAITYTGTAPYRRDVVVTGNIPFVLDQHFLTLVAGSACGGFEVYAEIAPDVWTNATNKATNCTLPSESTSKVVLMYNFPVRAFKMNISGATDVAMNATVRSQKQ